MCAMASVTKFLGLAVFLFACVGVRVVTGIGMAAASSVHEMRSSPDATQAPYDLQFLDTMMAHHESAIDMAKIASAKASHVELKRSAMKMVTLQEEEISRLQDWREQSYRGHPKAVNMRLPGMMDSMKGVDVDTLKATVGQEFDLLFLDMMIPHHEGVIPMAKDALERSHDSRIKDLVKHIMTEQQKEIRQMKEWRDTWRSRSPQPS
jgi:uncharacterized protein (DUF305 family)